MATNPLYVLRWEPQYLADAALIHPDFAALERATYALTTALERRPDLFQIFDQQRNLRVARVQYYVFQGPSATHVEPLLVTFRIERDHPDGLVSLRRVVTEADVRGGLHHGTPDLPSPDHPDPDYPFLPSDS